MSNMEGQQFSQLCVWEAMYCDNGEQFEKFMKDNFGFIVKFAEVAITLPSGSKETECGGRTDLFFYIEDGMCLEFALARFKIGRIRWWEDVLLNGGGKLYTEEILKKYPFSWECYESD